MPIAEIDRLAVGAKHAHVIAYEIEILEKEERILKEEAIHLSSAPPQLLLNRDKGLELSPVIIKTIVMSQGRGGCACT